MSTALPLVQDACVRLPHARRSMFGGHGFFAPNGGIFAAIVDEDRIILKFADDAAREELQELGGEPWTYAGKMTMREWILVPESFYDDPELLADWARRAHRLAPPKKAASKKAAPRRAATKKAATKMARRS